MPTCVVFSENGARVLKNPENLAELSALPNVLVDPDLSDVLNTPTHLWRMSGSKIVCVEEGSKEAAIIEQTLADKGVIEQPISKYRIIFYKLKPYLLVILGIAIGLLIGKL